LYLEDGNAFRNTRNVLVPIANPNERELVVNKIEEEKGPDCDVTPNEVLDVLRAERVELSIEEVSSVLADVL